MSEKLSDDCIRVVKVMNNKRVTDEFNGVQCYFRSNLEYRWAKYLQFLKEHGKIKSWAYETTTFNFQSKGYATSPFMYRPDFTIIENDGNILYQETKGVHDGSTNRKFQRTLECYRELSKNNFELILQRIPKDGKGANKRRIAEKYCRRVVDSSIILKQLGI